MLEDELDSTERRDLRRTARALLSRHLPPERAGELDRTRTFDREVWSELGAAGLLGIGAPDAQGGTTGTVGDSLVVVEEIARVLPSMAVDYVLAGMTTRLLNEVDHPDAARWAGDAASGALITSFAMSEPGAGTDLLALRTAARPTPDGWVLSGQKTWISLAQYADLLLVLARTSPATTDRRSSGISLLAVDPRSPGVSISKIPMAGMRAANSCEIHFDDVLVPTGALVGEEGAAMRLLGATLDVERVLAAGISLGIASAALDLHVRYAGEREAFGRPIGALQAVQHPAADSATELAASRALTATAVAAIEAGTPSTTLAAMAKLQAAETAARVVDRGMRAMGAMGLAEESAMQMYFRDARLQLFSPVSNEMTRNVIGQALGLPRSY
jgi:alkylation response protein AidB-like acyl-CoA dehydrogenase